MMSKCSHKIAGISFVKKTYIVTHYNNVHTTFVKCLLKDLNHLL